MAYQGNLLCDQDSCGNVAIAFGIDGTRKSKACSEHISDLNKKGMTTFPIAAFSFLQSFDDSQEYNRRKILTDSGFGHAEVFEARYEEDFEVGQTQLKEQHEALQLLLTRCMHEQSKLLQLHYSALRDQLAGLRAELMNFLENQEVQLSTAAHTLCEVLPSGQCLSVKTLDCSIALAKLALDSSSVLSVGPSVLRHQGDLLPELLPYTCSANEVQEAACALFSSAQKYSFSANYEACLKELERALNLLRLHSLRNDSVTVLYALTLAYFDQLDQAEEIVKYNVSKPELELAVLAFERGRWVETVTLCERSLSGQATEEGYFLLVHAYWHLDRNNDADFQLQKWTESGSAIRTSLAAEQLKRQGRHNEAKCSFKEAAALCSQQSVLIVCKASVLKSWGDLLEDCKFPAKAEHKYTQALQLLEAHLPHSLQHAICRNNLALVYDQLGLKAEAEAQFKNALQSYCSNYAHTKQYANCLLNLGHFYRFLGRKQEACKWLEEAKACYQALALAEDAQACSIALNYLR